MKKIISIIFILFIIYFLSLYMGRYYTSYYENQKILTDDAIKRFENDIKEGKSIDVSNYIKEDKDYSNKASRIGLKVSLLIEKSFDKVLRYVLKYLNSSYIY